jgi:DNA-3-methyladenine glycosylase II
MVLIRERADLDEGIRHLGRIDPLLMPIIARTGPVPLRLSDPGFAGLANIVVSQMVSKASAAAIWRRISAFGPVTADSYLAHEPQIVAGFGLSRAKAATLDRLARAILDGSLDLDALSALPDDEAMARLVALKGIGPWTAEVYLMFCLGRPDIFPAGDVALRVAVGEGLLLGARPPASEVSEIARRWSPWRSVAACLFWAFYARRGPSDALPIA